MNTLRRTLKASICVGVVLAITVAATASAAAPIRTDPIPASVGKQVDPYYLFDKYLLNAAGTPAGLDPAIFSALAQRTSARWGISAIGVTGRSPMSKDGVNTVGWTGKLPANALGVQITYEKLVRKRGKRRCRTVRTNSGRRVRRCRPGKLRVIGGYVTEQDLAVSTKAPWNQGPDYPTTVNFDLETVLLHEFGHFAGNEHVRGCVNSVMVDSSDTGEWWHATNDWRRNRCSNSAFMLAKPAIARSARVLHRRVVTDVTVSNNWKPPAGAKRMRPKTQR